MSEKKYYKWWAFTATGLMVLLVNLDATIVNLALPPIAQEMQASLSGIQWVIGSYLMTTAIFFTVGGRLADIYTHRTVFLIGTLFFGVSSLWAGYAHEEWSLIAARALQGIGFAFTLSQALIMTAQAFPLEQRGLAVGCSITITGIAQAIGPTVGGVILQFFGWRWILWMNVPIAILSIILTIWACPREKSHDPEGTLDYRGAILFTLGIFLYLLALNEVDQWYFSWPFILCLLSGFSFLVVFYYDQRQKKKGHPLMSVDLFKNIPFLGLCLVRAFYMFCFVNLLFIFPLYLQNILGYTPIKAGWILLCFSLISGITGPFIGRWIDQTGYREPLQLSLFLSLLACFLFTRLSIETPLWFLMLSLLIFGASISLMLVSTVNGVLVEMLKEHSGIGMGTFFTVGFTGASTGVALGGSLLGLMNTSTLFKQLAGSVATFSQQQLTFLNKAVSGVQPISDIRRYFSSGETQQLLPILKNSFMIGFSSVMWTNVAMLLMALILFYIVKKRDECFV